MPEVLFHTGVVDPTGYACRLLRKAWRQGRQVVVIGESARLQRLDALLWSFEQEAFVPHLRLKRGQPAAAVLQRTPIWLADAPLDAPSRDVLVNLGPDPTDSAQAFGRVIELVGESPDDVVSGRARWRQHKAAGLTPELAALVGADLAAAPTAAG